MARILYIHWNESEARAHAKALSAAGHRVDWHASEEHPARVGDELPDALVVSLDRLPSHGRRVAAWFWEAKKRRGCPIVFVGGAADKVAVARGELPGAQFCAREELASVLSDLPAGKPPARR